MLTVRRALGIGGLSKARLVAGAEGLDRAVEFVDILEVPDATGWIRPCEMVITCAYAIKDDPVAQVNLVRILSEAGAAALAIKPGRFLGEMPQAIIQAADEEGLPLLEIPADLPYIEITHPLLSEILNDQVRELEYEADVHRKLTRLVLDQRGLESIAVALCELLGAGVCILDAGFRVLAQSGELIIGRTEGSTATGDACQSIAEAVRCAVAGPVPDRQPDRRGIVAVQGFSYIPIRSGGTSLGFVAIDLAGRGPLTSLERRAVEQAATVSGLEIAKTNAVRETEARLRSDFFAEVLGGSAETPSIVAAKARILGIDDESPFVIAVAAMDDGGHSPVTGEPARQMAAAAKEECRLGCIQASVLEFHGTVVLVCAAPGGNLDRLVGSLTRVISRSTPAGPWSVSVGVSAVHRGVSNLSPAYSEARKALDLGKTIHGPGRFVTYGDLAAVLLLEGVDRSALGSFWRAQVGQLAQEDPRLVETLQAFLECGGELKKTSKALYVHRNTLAYRLRRIGAILGSDLRDPGVQFRLRLALIAKALSKGSDRH